MRMNKDKSEIDNSVIYMQISQFFYVVELFIKILTCEVFIWIKINPLGG